MASTPLSHPTLVAERSRSHLTNRGLSGVEARSPNPETTSQTEGLSQPKPEARSQKNIPKSLAKTQPFMNKFVSILKSTHERIYVYLGMC